MNIDEKMRDYLTRQLVELALAKTAEDKLMVLRYIYAVGHDSAIYEVENAGINLSKFHNPAKVDEFDWSTLQPDLY